MADDKPVPPPNPHKIYPRIEVACLNRAHPEIVHLVIKSGHATVKCPKCGRKIGRGD